MQALREKIVAITRNAVCEGDEDYWTSDECHDKIADRILAIPEIAEVLREKKHRNHDRYIELDKDALAKITESLKVEPPSDTLSDG